jgi:hypothetical protein
MGLFVVIFSIAVVIIQATSMLLGRSAHNWTFSLLESTPNTTSLTELQMLFKTLSPLYSEINKTAENNYNSTLQLYLESASDSVRAQASCIQLAWQYLTPPLNIPTYCMFNRHSNQEILPILQSWNPHLILLTLCCIHSVFCISMTHQSSKDNGSQSNNSPPKRLIIPLSYATGIYVLLIGIISIMQGLNNVDLVQYPTMILMITLIVFCILFVVRFPSHDHDFSWGISNHLQIVAVPLAVLAISTMGVRIWNDVLGHIVILSAAVNCLWLQCQTKHMAAQRISHILTVALPSLSLYLAHVQWGQYDDWRYVIGTMACASLAPFYLITILFHTGADIEKRKNEKYFSKISLLCSSAAILSLVVNLALF